MPPDARRRRRESATASPDPPRRRARIVLVAALFGAVVAVAAVSPDRHPRAGAPDDATLVVVAGGPRPDVPQPVPVEAVGRFDTVSVSGTTVTLTGWVARADGSVPAEIRFRVDGVPSGRVPVQAERFDVAAAVGTEAVTGFGATLDTGPGAHRICAYTTPEDELVTCTRVADDATDGVLVTPTDVMVEILAERPDGRVRVRTPCGGRAIVAGGSRIRTTQILVDPGHGGYESGSIGPNGLVEKDLNLAVSSLLADELRDRGYDVALTRTTDVTLPIEIRANLANALDPDLFVSVHHNGGATGHTPVPGTQVYYQHDDPESRRASGVLYEELFAAASRYPTAWVGNSKDGVSTRLNAERTDFYGIHRRTPTIASVITEFLWISNGPEARLLARDDVQRAEAVALADGIDRWYRTDHAGSGYLDPFVDTSDTGSGGFEGCTDPVLG